jgi:hypothetical protein
MYSPQVSSSLCFICALHLINRWRKPKLRNVSFPADGYVTMYLFWINFRQGNFSTVSHQRSMSRLFVFRAAIHLNFSERRNHKTLSYQQTSVIDVCQHGVFPRKRHTGEVAALSSYLQPSYLAYHSETKVIQGLFSNFLLR